MKLSRFLRDVVFTSFSQVIVLALGIVFLKMSALLLDKEQFGLLIVFRRWVAVFIPLFSLNVGLSLTRYVSFNKEKREYYLKLAVVLCNWLFIPAATFALLAPRTVSRLLFDRPDFVILTIILAFFMYVNIVQLNLYSYYRGMRQMNAANLINIAFYSLPALAAAPLFLFKSTSHHTRLILIYGICTFPVLLFLGYRLIRRRVFSFRFPSWTEELRGFIAYGVGRLPSSFFLSILLGLPVLWAKDISLEYAGMAGIFVNVMRLLEIFSEPFNKVFLPKFSEHRGEGREDHIRQHSRVLLEFMFSFFPILVILAHGLSRHIVIFWFSGKYLGAVSGVRISILFSFFYLIYAMLRGVLNGLFDFPHVNVICLLGVAVAGLTTFTFMNQNLEELALSFGLGLTALGIASAFILIYKLKLKLDWRQFLPGAAASVFLFVICGQADRLLQTVAFPNIYIEFVVLALYRVMLLVPVFLFVWKKSAWFGELIKRMNSPVEPLPRNGAANEAHSGNNPGNSNHG